jgi:hypothetical protein
VDADGDLDVVVANEGQNQLFLNEDGVLVDVTARNLPLRVDETREIRAVDVDGDGDPDLVVANVSFVLRETPQDYLLLNDGSGVFTTADTARFPEDARSNFTVQAVDLDRDGDMDALAPSTEFAARAGDYLVLSNDGSGRFSVVAAHTIVPAATDGNGFDIEVADFDADGITDLFFCNRASSTAPGAAATSGGLQRLLLGKRILD